MNVTSMIQPASRLACVLALSALAAAGCGKVAEEASEAAIEMGMPDGSNVEIDAEGGNVTIQGADGSINMQTGEAVALPADFPSDVPLPENATWHMVQNIAAEGASNVTVQGTVSASLAEVAASLKEKATAQGWESVTNFEQAGESAIMSYRKGERTLSLSVTRDGDNTSVMISSQ